MGEISRWLVVEHGVFHAQLVEQFGQNNASHAVHRIDNNFKSGLTNGISINQLQCQHAVDVALVETIVLTIMAQVVYVCIGKVTLIGYLQKFCAIFGRKKLTFIVEQFQSVPLARIMTCGDNYTPIGSCHSNGQLCSRRCGQPDVQHIKAHSHERTTHNVLNHIARNTCIAANNDGVVALWHALTNESGVRRSKLNDV